jgi:hypothetical protein
MARLTRDPRYGLPYHGLSGLQVGFLVAFTQLIPEHQVQLLGLLKLRVKVSSSTLSEGICLFALVIARNLPPPLQHRSHRSGSLPLHAHSIRLLRCVGLSPVLQDIRRWKQG